MTLDQINEFRRVAQVAWDTAFKVMSENYESKLAAGDMWSEKSIAYHAEHGHNHGQTASVLASYGHVSHEPNLSIANLREEAEHALCRWAMVLTLLAASPAIEKQPTLPTTPEEVQIA